MIPKRGRAGRLPCRALEFSEPLQPTPRVGNLEDRGANGIDGFASSSPSRSAVEHSLQVLLVGL